MRHATRALLLLTLVGLFGCSGPVACGALKRFIYEPPGRDRWQKPDEVIAALGIAGGETVADLGAGGGYFTFRLARAVGKGGRVYAVDVDTSLLAYVAHQAAERGLPQVETVLAREDGMGLPDGSLDLIFLANVFHHLPDPERYFARARSALRPGARVAVAEASEGGFPSGHATPPEEIRSKLEAAGFVLAKRYDFLERQSFQVFELAQDGPTPSELTRSAHGAPGEVVP